MNDYLTNLIQREQPHTQSSVRPLIEPLYFPVNDSAMLHESEAYAGVDFPENNRLTSLRKRENNDDLPIYDKVPESHPASNEPAKLTGKSHTIEEASPTENPLNLTPLITSVPPETTGIVSSGSSIEKENEIRQLPKERVDRVIHKTESVTVTPEIQIRTLSGESSEIVGKSGSIRPREENHFENKPDVKSKPSVVPTIKVSIGRIDIRAVTPPVAPGRMTKSTPPKMSLNEYLNQRKGGRK